MMDLYRFAWMAALLATASAWAAPGTMIRDDQLRASSSASSAVTGQVAKGANVDILTQQGGWTQVRVSGKTGWVRMLSVRAGAAGKTDAAGELGTVLGMGTRSSDPGRVVSVAGVRGLNEEDLKAARYSPQEIERLELYAVRRAEAEQFARQAGLVARPLAYLAPPAKQAGKESRDSPWGESQW